MKLEDKVISGHLQQEFLLLSKPEVQQRFVLFETWASCKYRAPNIFNVSLAKMLMGLGSMKTTLLIKGKNMKISQKYRLIQERKDHWALVSSFLMRQSSSGVRSFWHHWFKSSFPFLVTLASQLLVAVKEVMHVPLLPCCLAFSLANMVCQS